MDFGGDSSPFLTCAGISGQAQPPPAGSPTLERTNPHPPPQSQPLWVQFQTILVSTENIPEACDGFGGCWKTFPSTKQLQTFESSILGHHSQAPLASHHPIPDWLRALSSTTAPNLGSLAPKMGWLENSQLTPSLFQCFWCFPQCHPQPNTLSFPREQFPPEGGEREAGKEGLGGSQGTGCVPGRLGWA